jgi:hypothetical protein
LSLAQRGSSSTQRGLSLAQKGSSSTKRRCRPQSGPFSRLSKPLPLRSRC